MPRLRPTPLSLLLLLCAACSREPLAEARTGSPAAAEPAAAAAARTELAATGLLVRYALLVGDRGAGELPAAAAVLSRDELTKSLLDWDAAADSAEVKRVFALHHIGEVARQAYELPAGGGHARGFYNYGGAVYELVLEVRPQAGDAILFKAEIRRDRETLSAPQLMARLGERAIVSTDAGGKAPFLFFVVEASPAAMAGGGAGSPPARAVAPGPDGIYKVDGDRIRAPKNLHRVNPSYTEAARKAGVSGQVVLECVVDQQGAVTDVELVRGLPEGLSEAAIQAVRQWRFEPTRLDDGRPVKVRFTLTINFKLDKDEDRAR